MAEALPPNDLSMVARYIKSEFETRKQRRKDLEVVWKEVDRQIAMTPFPRELQSGKKNDWLPDLELPLQFNTLEVNAADARRLKFPRGSEWYSVSANLTDEYQKRWTERREKHETVGKFPDGRPIPIKLDQDTANIYVKAVLDHFHRLYDFRGMVDLFDAECIKYGTGAARIRQVSVHKFFPEYRGAKPGAAMAPAFIPASIKNTYLDDSPIAVMHEGILLAPGHIRCSYKQISDLKRAIAAGGPERGWRQEAIAKLKPLSGRDSNKGLVEILEYEGDLVVPRSDTSAVYLPNAIVTIALGRGVNEVIRFQENKFPFNSYVVGHYFREKIDSAYGVSPLMKGQPIQEAATESLNALMAAAALAARPPCFYDRNDAELKVRGGPDLFPGSLTPTESPDAVEFMERADIGQLLNVYLGLLKQYEDLTSVNDPRRGGATKSHTTATAVDIEQSRGISRVDDFVQGVELGPMTSMLHMEYEIAKDSLKTPQHIQADMGGIEGWFRASAADLADQVAFRVHGSAGVLNERQQAENFAAATNMVLQLAGTAAQLGVPLSVDFQAIAEEAYRKAGVNNAGRFITTAKAISNESPPGAAVPSNGGGIPTNTLSDVETALGI